MKRRLDRRYVWNGQIHQVEGEIEKDQLYVELDGKPWTFTIVPGPPGAFVLAEGDRVHTGYAVPTKGAVWVQLDGRTYVLEHEKPSRTRTGAPGPTGGDVISPMTGTVRKIFVEAGQPVSPGAPLLVVEAMKMEFTVTGPGEGRINKVLCEPGQPVDLGQILIHFEPVETEEP